MRLSKMTRYSLSPGDTDAAVQALLSLYRDRVLLEKQLPAARLYFETHFDRSIATGSFDMVSGGWPPTHQLSRSI